MSQNFVLKAQSRADVGKGASRRLRREQGLLPAIIYGGSEQPLNLTMEQREVKKALESEAFYTSILNIDIDGKRQKAVVKAIQRHPYKPVIQHMDFLRVTKDAEITMIIPIHYINEDTAPGVKQGGVVSHTMTEVEIKCKAKDLPEFFEIDMSTMELDQVLHLSDIKLPAGVELTTDISDSSHNLPIASIHTPKAVSEEEETVEAEATEEEAQAEDKSEDQGKSDE